MGPKVQLPRRFYELVLQPTILVVHRFGGVCSAVLQGVRSHRQLSLVVGVGGVGSRVGWGWCFEHCIGRSFPASVACDRDG